MKSVAKIENEMFKYIKDMEEKHFLQKHTLDIRLRINRILTYIIEEERYILMYK